MIFVWLSTHSNCLQKPEFVMVDKKDMILLQTHAHTHTHTHIQTLRSHFQVSEFQLTPPYPFSFPLPSPTERAEEWERESVTWEPELEIRFPRELPESGWKLALDSDGKVKYS